MSETEGRKRPGRPKGKVGPRGTTLILRRCRYFPALPSEWLRVEEWAKRAGMSPRALRVAIESGLVPITKMAAVPNERGFGKVLAIAWDTFSYEFFAARDPFDRPADFFECPERLYKPLVRPQPVRPPEGPDEYWTPPEALPDAVVDANGEDIETEELERAVNSGDMLTDGMHLERVVDYSSARYRRECLKILKDQLELRVAKNELVPVADVDSELRRIATEIQAEFTKMESQLAPILAACTDPREVRRVLSDAIARALAPLADRGDDGPSEKTDP